MTRGIPPATGPGRFRAAGAARLRSPGPPRRRAAMLALLLAFAPLTAPAALAQTSTYVPGQGVDLPDTDRAAAIAAQRRTIAEHQEAARSAADEGGMPQLDFANPLTISQVVWLLVIFGLFLFIVSHYLLPPVNAVLTDRRARIGADLDAARAAKAEADAAAEEHRGATARARAEAQAAVTDAVQAANADAAARTQVLNARLAEQVAAAETRIGAARDAAMGALREVSTDAAGALVERLAGIRDAAAVSAAVDRALAARAPAGGRG